METLFAVGTAISHVVQLVCLVFGGLAVVYPLHFWGEATWSDV